MEFTSLTSTPFLGGITVRTVGTSTMGWTVEFLRFGITTVWNIDLDTLGGLPFISGNTNLASKFVLSEWLTGVEDIVGSGLSSHLPTRSTNTSRSILVKDLTVQWRALSTLNLVGIKGPDTVRAVSWALDTNYLINTETTSHHIHTSGILSNWASSWVDCISWSTEYSISSTSIGLQSIGSTNVTLSGTTYKTASSTIRELSTTFGTFVITIIGLRVSKRTSTS
jgi:hypothetical protein